MASPPSSNPTVVSIVKDEGNVRITYRLGLK